MLKKKDSIISRVKSCNWITSHKPVIALQHSAEEAYNIDEKNRNDFCQYAIDKEVKNIRDMENIEMMEGVKPEDI